MSGYTISTMKSEPGTETVCLEFTNGQDTKTLDMVITTTTTTCPLL